ncbi:hypothetical protein V5O48_001416 [Marasmius crinis-equi]|uniref:C3H1-type domain-containing protein n=1 Tax=Marasmius crinis-equi TaxID=585013 RepID=A0ABR3FZ63_9AGAR
MPRPSKKSSRPASSASRVNVLSSTNSTSTPAASTAPSPKHLAKERVKKREARAKQRKEAREKLKNEGNEFFKAGRYLEAAQKYEQAVNLGGKKPVLLTNLAAAWLKLGLFEQAEDVCTEALVFDPTNTKARYRRGLARKELRRARGAIKDFQTIQKHAPDVASELRGAREIVQRGQNSISDDEFTENEYHWPPYKETHHKELESESGSSDCEHTGNGVSCKYYNQGRCTRGRECIYSHAPDDRSVRDKLGRNVCLFHLITSCEFGSLCMYSHDKTYLPAKGWWNDEELNAKLFEDVLITRLHCPHGEDEREVVDMMHKLIYEWGYNTPRNLDVLLRRGTWGHSLNAFLKARQNDESSFPIQALAAVASSPAISNRFVMLLSLRKEHRVQDDQKHIHATLREVGRVKEALTTKTALSWMTSRDLGGVFITDFEIAEPENRQLLLQVVEYAKAGGLVVAGGQFSAQMCNPNEKTFFHAWGLPWERGSYNRTTFQRNDGSEIVKQNPSLPLSYTMKAVHLRGIRVEDAVYLPVSNADSDTESPILYAKVGKGHFGFIGDVNGEGTTGVLIHLLAPPNDESAPNLLRMQQLLKASNPLYDAKRPVRRAGRRTWSNTMSEAALEEGIDGYEIRDLLRGF